MKPFIFSVLFLLSYLASAQPAKPMWSGSATVEIATAGKPRPGQQLQVVAYRTPQTDQALLTDVAGGSIRAMMMNAFAEGRLTGYTGPTLKKSVSANEIASFTNQRDTIVLVDPDTYQTTMRVVAREFSADNFPFFRLHVKMILSDDGSLNQRATAVAISDQATFPDGATVYFPVDTKDEALELSAPSWNAVVRNSINIPAAQLTTDSGSKGTLKSGFKQLETIIPGRGKSGFRNTADWGELNRMDFGGLQGGTDTVPIVDPDTYEVKYDFIERRSFGKEAEDIRLYHFLAWDDKAGRLVLSPIGYAPLRVARDENGERIFSGPLINWLAPWYR